MGRDLHLREQIAGEAADWFARLRDGGDGGAAREEFTEWLLRSPAHIEEFLAVTSTWGNLQIPSLGRVEKTSDDRYSVEQLVAAARASSERENIIALNERAAALPLGGVGSAGFPPRVLGRRPLLIAASVVLASFVGGLTWWYSMRAPTFATDIGEQRSIALADGSTVDLNSKSRIRVRFTEQERAIDLLAGQGLFRVAKDASRPFVVHSDGTRVRAVGTAFDVYRRASATVVTVLEGKVEVDALALEEGEGRVTDVPLVAGEQVTLTAGRLAKPKAANVAAATAWTQRRIVFESAPLAEVAQEFNRYNARQLVIPVGELENFHISGVFSSTDPASLLRFLREQPGLMVEEDEDEIRILPVSAEKNF